MRTMMENRGEESKAPFTWERFQNRTDRPRVYTGTDETVPYRTASSTRTGLLRK